MIFDNAPSLGRRVRIEPAEWRMHIKPERAFKEPHSTMLRSLEACCGQRD